MRQQENKNVERGTKTVITGGRRTKCMRNKHTTKDRRNERQGINGENVKINPNIEYVIDGSGWPNRRQRDSKYMKEKETGGETAEDNR